MKDLLDLLTQIYSISTKDMNVYKEIKEIIYGAAKMLEGGSDEK